MGQSIIAVSSFAPVFCETLLFVCLFVCLYVCFAKRGRISTFDCCPRKSVSRRARLFARTHKSNDRTPTMGRSPLGWLSPKQKMRTAMAIRQFPSKAASAKKNKVGDAHRARPLALTWSSHLSFSLLLTDHATCVVFFVSFVSGPCHVVRGPQHLAPLRTISPHSSFPASQMHMRWEPTDGPPCFVAHF
jgi:hypothetical protein